MRRGRTGMFGVNRRQSLVIPVTVGRDRNIRAAQARHHVFTADRFLQFLSVDAANLAAGSDQGSTLRGNAAASSVRRSYCDQRACLLVVRRQLKRSSVLLNVCYELAECHDDRLMSCRLAITFHQESLQVTEIRAISHRFHADLGHSDRSHVDLCETGLQSDEILILPHG